MPRYIIIDTHTGYIFDDRVADDPITACCQFDESIGVRDRRYVEHVRKSRHSSTDGYDVYRADINGSEAVPVVHDGQDPETIAAVIRDCEHVAFVTVETEVDAFAEMAERIAE